MTAKYEQIAGGLIQDILSGRYLAQDRLPSERDLAARFDANRGAVREAMKKLEALGFVDVQPGGARVRARTEASLEAIGHMLSQGELPDRTLIDQILVVMGGLMNVAAEEALRVGSAEEIAEIRKRAQILADEVADEERHILARFELMRSLMESSNNLPLQIIARTLLSEFLPHIGFLAKYAEQPSEAFVIFARQLDQALANKDADALRASFSGLFDLNRQTMQRAYELACADLVQEAISS